MTFIQPRGSEININCEGCPLDGVSRCLCVPSGVYLIDKCVVETNPTDEGIVYVINELCSDPYYDSTNTTILGYVLGRENAGRIIKDMIETNQRCIDDLVEDTADIDDFFDSDYCNCCESDCGDCNMESHYWDKEDALDELTYTKYFVTPTKEMK